MKKKAGLIALFLLGLAIMLYPTISDLWNSTIASKVINEYTEAVDSTSDAQKEADLAQARAYNEQITMESVPDAFSVRDNVQDTTYEAILNPNGDGIMGSVSIPSINVEIPIYHYTTEEVLQKGAGHLFGSSFPIGGESTHAVISAHRGLPSAKLFTDLNLLKEGDIFYITVYGEKLAYEVKEIVTVLPSQTDSLAIRDGEDLVSLITCTPYSVNTHRLIVTGHRTTIEEAERVPLDQPRIGIVFWLQILMAVLGIAIGAGAGYLYLKSQGKIKGRIKKDSSGEDQQE